ncbi:MAG: lycopene cyclase domain-containing protein [Candidatus Kariarchaeaceae archaeon]|jgi:lycopene cyclase domain-containing protein
MISYFNVLLIFIIPPIILLGILTKVRFKTIKIFSLDSISAIIFLSIIAFIYTTPWDNYLVSEGIWFYDSELISGIVIFWVPIEEYLFFILETILVALLYLNINTVNMKEQLELRTENMAHQSLRVSGFVLIMSIWLISFFLFVFGPNQYSYISLILIWALLPIAIQVIYGADIIIDNLVPVSLTIIISTIYLSLVDAYAIYSGTWTISPNTSLEGFKIGIMPIEEIMFFLLTSILVTFGMLLSTNYKSRIRLFILLDRIKLKNYRMTLVKG